MADKGKGIGVLIALGDKKKKEENAEIPPPPGTDGEEEPMMGDSFDEAAEQCFEAAKADDKEGFASALRLAIEALL